MDVKHKQGLPLVELDENEVVLGDQDLIQDNEACNAEITLYALVGNLSSNTMRVKSRIKNQEIISFINLGGTHNFLDAAMLLNLNLQIDTSLILEMKVAIGSLIKKKKKIFDGATYSIQSIKFVIDLNVLHLGGCEVVLATKWLSTFG